MAMHQVTLALPEAVYRLAEQTAETTRCTVETVLVEALAAALSPISDLKEEKVFSIADNSFFSLPPEHLRRTSVDELDKIIADEAQGCE